MKLNGLVYLAELADFPPNTFERRFGKLSTRMGLGACMTRRELRLLFDAAFFGCLCNISFNGLGGCDGEIRPEGECNRIRLEQDFMETRAQFLRTPGWKGLRAAQKKQVTTIFLTVLVADANLAQ